jgi:hypothetical protein
VMDQSIALGWHQRLFGEYILSSLVGLCLTRPM